VGNVGRREHARKVAKVHDLFRKLGNLKNVREIRMFGITWA